MYYLFKYSILLIATNFVFLSHQLQPCLGIFKPPNQDYTFALAYVDDARNPLAPQEACYYSCGAQIVTQSSNRGDMARLTLMDISASVLTSNGFLKVGESYLLNHLGLEDAEGGNGIGCIQIKPGNQLNHFPKSHPVCSMARVAVCGFWGQQSLPSIPSGMKMTKSTAAGAVKTTTTSTKAITTSTKKTVPTAIFPDIATQTDLSVFIDKKPPVNPATLPRFSYNGKTFYLITKSQGSLVAADNSCKQNQGTVATITTDSFRGISDSLKKMGYSRLIIGSWNGDTYSLTGSSCLILHTDYGIYPGSCAEALSVLCQAK